MIIIFKRTNFLAFQLTNILLIIIIILGCIFESFFCYNQLARSIKLSEENIILEQYSEMFKNLSMNLNKQNEILDKLNKMLVNQLNEVNKLSNSIKEFNQNFSNSKAESFGNSNNSSILNAGNSNADMVNNNNNILQKFSSNFCNPNTNECISIIDIQDNFLYYLLNKPKEKLFVSNNIFKVIDSFDILDQQLSTEDSTDSFVNNASKNKNESNIQEQENIVDYTLIDFKNLIGKNPTLFANLVYKTNNQDTAAQDKKKKKAILNYLTFQLVITNKAILIYDVNSNLVENYNLGLKSDIIKADLSYFDEDNSIILMTQSLDVYYITLDLDLVTLAYRLNLIESYKIKGEKLTVNFFIKNFFIAIAPRTLHLYSYEKVEFNQHTR